jgi:arylamine N-acetyltransferase
MLDVGFGGGGATKPLPLISEHVTQNLGRQEICLLHSAIPQQMDQSQKLWIYQYHNRKDKEWDALYAFPEAEFLPVDFEVTNFFKSQSTGKTHFQTRIVLIC